MGFGVGGQRFTFRGFRAEGYVFKHACKGTFCKEPPQTPEALPSWLVVALRTTTLNPKP